jgi:hypothetical protein
MCGEYTGFRPKFRGLWAVHGTYAGPVIMRETAAHAPGDLRDLRSNL